MGDDGWVELVDVEIEVGYKVEGEWGGGVML